MTPASTTTRLCVVCPRTLTKAVKDVAKTHGILHAVARNDAGDSLVVIDHSVTCEDVDAYVASEATLAAFVADLEPGVRFSTFTRDNSPPPHHASPMVNALTLCFSGDALPRYLDNIPRWDHYDDFILFQAGAFSHEPWTSLTDSTREHLFQCIANAFSVHHIAEKGDIQRSDRSRRPNIKVLHGDFGVTHKKTFWTSTSFSVPRGVIQYTWAPVYSMYSRGNSREKIRISQLDNVKDSIVVDLYAGIGYFTFAYLKAGAKCVFACDINPYATEGLRRGALLNHYTVKSLPKLSSLEGVVPRFDLDHDIYIMNVDNVKSLPYFEGMATHVNMGLLPKPLSISIAIRALRNDRIGYLHYHFELRVSGTSQQRLQCQLEWAEQLVKEVQEEVEGRKVELVEITCVKSMGPSTLHVVAQLKVY